MLRQVSRFVGSTVIIGGGCYYAASSQQSPQGASTKRDSLSPSTRIFSSFPLISLAKCDSPPLAHASTQSSAIQKKVENIEHILEQYRPDSNKYERVDHVIFEDENNAYFRHMREQHAVYTSLHGESRIEAYEIYRAKDTEEIYCVIKFGDKLNGWPNIVHGGITALLLDNTYGWLFTTYNKPKAVTANLNINYR